MTDVRELHKTWMKEPGYKAAYEGMASEFAVAAAIIDARSKAGLSQEQLAERMKTKQPFVARLESGAQNTTLKTLQRFAEATGTRLKITFESIPVS
jgi:ribosome-binding protein aMBF1 (putative translation factor)